MHAEMSKIRLQDHRSDEARRSLREIARFPKCRNSYYGSSRIMLGTESSRNKRPMACATALRYS